MLKKDFFERSAIKVAKDLLGCLLCTPKGKFMIVETEAYEGPRDKASHASRGETSRNSVMFGEPGIWYVYFTYGMHYMLNIVCGKKGHPAAVLIRGVERIEGVKGNLVSFRSTRTQGAKKVESLIGPGRLTKKLGIDKKFNGQKASKRTGLWIESYINNKRNHEKMRNSKSRFKKVVLRTPRIGVSYAGPIWSQKLYRFVLAEYEKSKKSYS